MRTATRRITSRSRYRRPGPRPGLIAAIALGIAGLLAVGIFFFLLARPSDRSTCVEVIGADRSESQRSVTEEWLDESDKIIDEAARCEGLIIAQGVFDETRTGSIHHISFQVDAINRLDKQAKLSRQKELARDEVRKIFTQPAAGGTDLLGWFQRVDNHLEGIDGKLSVNVTLFTDGINTRAPVRMGEADLSDAGVAVLIDRLRPDLPECEGWEIAMLGVNRTEGGRVPNSRAEGAERFWRAYVDACGGRLVRYDAAAQIVKDDDRRS